MIAATWSYILCAIILYQNPSQVGPGAAVIIVAGLLIYYVGIPKSRRGVMTHEVPSTS